MWRGCLILGPIWALSLLAGSAFAGPDAHRTAAEVDRLLASEVYDADTVPAATVDDETFLRRVTLDLVGDLPTPEQITAFVLDPAQDKRAAAVERLLVDEQFGQNWARYWRDVILSRRTEERAMIVANPLVVYLTEALNEGTSWSKIAREFITARGNIREDGRTAIFAAQDGRPEEVAAEVSRIFLGVQIQCAQCHDHKTDRWKREQFHQMAAFFPRVAVRPLLTDTQRTLVVAVDDRKRAPRRPMPNRRRGTPEHYMPDLENPSAQSTRMTPVFFLTRQRLPLGTPDAERRGKAAKWITGSRWFARAFVNRMWAEMVGQGFYEPIDDLGPDHVSATPRTIDYLAAQFVASSYDVRWLLRTIAATQTYQRESRPRQISMNAPFVANCQQRLRGDQLYNALTSALEIGDLSQGGRPRGGMGRLRGPRAVFNGAFGYDPSVPRDEVTASIPQALAMMNAPQINQQINGRRSGTMLGRLLREVDDDEDVVVELYLRCLAREPTSKELQTCLTHVRSVGNRVEAFEDILWAQINSAEFLHRK